MSETFDIEILRHALVKAVERYDAGIYEGSLEAYAPELLEAFTRLEQAEHAVERVREVAAGWATNDRPFREALIRALDGDGRG